MLFLTIITDSIERDILKELYHQYRRDLYVTAYAILKDHSVAEDMVQDTFIRLNNHLEKINEIKCNKTRSFLVTIVKNLSLDYLRKENEQFSTGFETVEHSLPDISGTPEDVLLRMELTEEMSHYLSQINESYAEAIMLRYYEGLTGKEIAKCLNITEGNARIRLTRGLKALKKMMHERRAVYDG